MHSETSNTWLHPLPLPLVMLELGELLKLHEPQIVNLSDFYMECILVSFLEL